MRAVRALLVVALLSLLALSVLSSGAEARRHHGEEQHHRPHRPHHRPHRRPHHPRNRTGVEGEEFIIDASNIEQMFQQAEGVDGVKSDASSSDSASLPAVIDSSNVDFVFAPHLSEDVPNASAKGVDVSQGFSTSTWKCMVNSGYSFAIVRGWQSLCRLDPNARSNIANARAGGMKYVDVYLFPAFRCGLSAAQQVDGLIDGLKGLNYGMIWMDVEASGSSWGSASQSLAWLRAAVNRAASRIGRKKIGIYTNKYNWQSVMGNAREFGDLPVWYAHYDNKPNFSDWSPFGAWSKPAIKQYLGDKTLCGAGVDFNWYPL